MGTMNTCHKLKLKKIETMGHWQSYQRLQNPIMWVRLCQSDTCDTVRVHLRDKVGLDTIIYVTSATCFSFAIISAIFCKKSWSNSLAHL